MQARLPKSGVGRILRQLGEAPVGMIADSDIGQKRPSGKRRDAALK